MPAPSLHHCWPHLHPFLLHFHSANCGAQLCGHMSIFPTPRPIPSSERNASVVPTQSCLQPLPETPSLSGAERSKSGSLQLSTVTQGGQGVRAREVNCRPGLQRRLAYTDSTARADPALPVTMRFRPFRPCTDEGGGVQLAA